MAKKKAAKSKKKPAAKKKAVKKKAPARKPAKKTPAKKAKKKASKAAAKKKPAARKKAVKKKAPVKKVAKKAPAKKVAKKAPAKKAAKKASKATAAKKAAPAVKEEAEESIIEIKPRKIPAKEKKLYRMLLQKFRDRIVDDITFLAGDNLNRSQKETSGDLSSYSFHMADQGTDNFDREFALNRVSSEQDMLYEVDEAFQRIDQGTYGICQLTGNPIEEERLKAMPHTRYCLAAQAELEKSRTRYRPFGPTITQSGSM